MHPADAIRGAHSDLLADRRIVLGVTGSISAVRVVELARVLIRHGAHVIPVMSKDAMNIIHPYALEFATGVAPITKITGQVEHVRWMGSGTDKADLLLIAPCTGNTISKIAHGIDDTVVTTFAVNAIGSQPIVIAPAMHDTMYSNPQITANLATLRAIGIHVLDPQFAEHKAKLAEPFVITDHVVRVLGPNTLAGKRVLVVNGATREAIDGMRVISNRASGRMGQALVVELFRAGADVTHWCGHSEFDHWPDVPTRRFSSMQDLMDMLKEAGEFDIVLVPAALSDFAPDPMPGKIPSDGPPPTLALEPMPKFVRTLHERFPDVKLVPFKAEADDDRQALLTAARKSLERNGAIFVVANDLGDVTLKETKAILVGPDGATDVSGTKRDVARAIVERLAEATTK